MEEDQYLTISKPSEGFFKDKGSKFNAFIYPIDSEGEAMEWVKYHKLNEPSARHHCFAYRIGIQGEIFRSYDDGEPSGTAGKPIYNQLLSTNITNVIVIVVRYFGGTKLGVPGLINAYKLATVEAIQNAEIITKTKMARFHISFSYNDMPSVMKFIKQNHIEIIDQKFDLECNLILEIPSSQASFLEESLEKLPCKYLK